MKISALEQIEKYTTLQGAYDDGLIRSGYTSDLLSDVMANAEEGSVLITIQAHKNTVAVASLAGIAAIIVCNNRPATDDMLEAAREEGIAVFQTPENQFQTSYRMAQLLGAG
jgi:hypothetical protein